MPSREGRRRGAGWPTSELGDYAIGTVVGPILLLRPLLTAPGPCGWAFPVELELWRNGRAENFLGMALPACKTKIVATIGPASSSPEVLRALLEAGMNVARINFSHGTTAEKALWVARLREASARTGRRVAILGDLPGPKLRIGDLVREPVELGAGRPFVLTTEPRPGDETGVWIDFEPLPHLVRPGQLLFLNDGLVQIEVESVVGREIRGRVRVGGELRSRKGLNVPGLDLGPSAFTELDRACLKVAAELGLDMISQSFVQRAQDVHAVREAARGLGYDPMVIAKIERALALDHLDEILDAADGVMVARGDLGVEIPIERMALVQKTIIREANRRGKPVITATQMLESMTTSRLPTRAEATDVANAILDGTDALMLSAESAIGRYPVESVAMLARIAAAVEPVAPRAQTPCDNLGTDLGSWDLRDVVARAVAETFDCTGAVAVLVPTLSGATARSVARYRLPGWIVAVSPVEATCQRLLLTRGVWSEHHLVRPPDWNAYARAWARQHGLRGKAMLLTEGPSPANPRANHRLEILALAEDDLPAS